MSNFGYGGTNSHVILDDPSNYKARFSNGFVNGTRQSDKSYRRVFLLSAKDEGAITSVKANLQEYLGQKVDQAIYSSCDDLAYTLGQRRSVFSWVTAISATSIQDLKEKLGSDTVKPTRSIEMPRLGFVFTGQGAQWHAMGRELISAYPIFGSTVHEADECMKDFGCSWSVYGMCLMPATWYYGT